MKNEYPCDEPKGRPANKGGKKDAGRNIVGPEIIVKSVTEATSLLDVFLNCYAVFGGGILRKLVMVLDKAIGDGAVMVGSIAGPLTVSAQHFSYYNDLLKTGWYGWVNITDATRYHDLHRSLRNFRKDPFHTVPMSGHDLELRKLKEIRVTDAAFKEDILLDQDQQITAMFLRPEFQKAMTTTEQSYLIGKYADAQERAFKQRSGFMATLYQMGIPAFCGAPADGSVALNLVKLRELARLKKVKFKFDWDLAEDVVESCAYHVYMKILKELLAMWILGGGVPKNYGLQPEPGCSQVFWLEEIGGFDYDVQIVSSPVSDGSLSSCEPAEAHTWGKVTADALQHTTASLNGTDYSLLMPLIAKALLDKRAFYLEKYERHGPKVFEWHPDAKGYIREKLGKGNYRLYYKRDEAKALFRKRISDPKHLKRLMETTEYPLQLLKKNLHPKT